MTINRPLKPWRTTGGDWRGGRVVAINGQAITIRVRAEASYVHEYTVDRALFRDPPVLEGACVVKVGNLSLQTAVPDYLITEVRGAQFCGVIESTADRENWGHVAYQLTGESPYWPWTPDDPASQQSMSRDRW
jgi:hypothetical protein